jgi:hypothetical protein
MTRTDSSDPGTPLERRAKPPRRGWRSRAVGSLAACAVLSGPGAHARAQSPGSGALMAEALRPDPSRAEARRADAPGGPGAHYGAGYRLAEAGDYEGAAREFEMAYRLEPNPRVLFNLGQAYAAAGQPVAAYDAFAQYLRLVPLDAEREEAVQQAMRIAEGRTGWLWVEVAPAGASIEIDGQVVGHSPLASALRLKTGPHALVLRADGVQTEARNIAIDPDTDLRVDVRLEPLPEAPSPGFVVVRCGTPDMEIWVDGQRRATTPLSNPLALSPGAHSVSLLRRGYVPESSDMTIDAGFGQVLGCTGRIDPELAAIDAATLIVSAGHLEGARVEVDGRSLSESEIVLPSGRHRVSIRGSRYQTWSRSVRLEAASTLRLVPRLVLTEEYRRESASRGRESRLWGGILAGSGAALLGTAVTLSLVASSRHGSWARERDALNGTTTQDADVAARLRQGDREALVIQRLGDAALGTAILGGLALGAGSYLWLSADPGAGVRVGVTSQGGSVSYGGRF